MLKRSLTYLFILPLLSLLNGEILYAASTDPIINAMDTGANYINIAGTAQEQVASYATDYMSGKIGELGDVNGVSKAAKRAEKAKKKAEKLKKMKEKADKLKAKAEKVKGKIDDAKDWAGDKIDKAQNFKDDVKGKIDDAKSEYDKAKSEVDKAKSEIDKAKAEYDNAKAMVDEAKTTVNEAKETASALSQTAKAAGEAAQNKVSSAVDRAPFNTKSSGDIVTVSAPKVDNYDVSPAAPTISQPMAVDTAGIAELAQPSYAVDNMGAAVNAGINAEATLPIVQDAVQPAADTLVGKVKRISEIAETATDEQELAETVDALPILSEATIPELTADAVKSRALELKQSNLSAAEAEPVLKTDKSLKRQLWEVERRVVTTGKAENAAVVSKKLKDSEVISNKVSDSVSRRRVFGKTTKTVTKEISNE